MELRFPSHFVFTILIIALLFALTNGIHHNENHKSTESRKEIEDAELEELINGGKIVIPESGIGLREK
ncbi:pectate lyase [Trifolium repens]|nr:pectate lyase [Trifolium repens]